MSLFWLKSTFFGDKHEPHKIKEGCIMKRILIFCVALVFVFSLVSTTVVFSSEDAGEKAAQAEEAKKAEAAAPAEPEEAEAAEEAAESEEAKAAEEAEPEKVEEGETEKAE
jgi:flagellar basal body-associated protein FliL